MWLALPEPARTACCRGSGQRWRHSRRGSRRRPSVRDYQPQAVGYGLPKERQLRMSVSVRIPTILRTYTGGSAEVSADPGTLREVIASLDTAYPGLSGRIVDDTGNLRRFVNVYVGDEDVHFANGLETPVPAGAHVSVIPAVAGG